MPWSAQILHRFTNDFGDYHINTIHRTTSRFKWFAKLKAKLWIIRFKRNAQSCRASTHGFSILVVWTIPK